MRGSAEKGNIDTPLGLAIDDDVECFGLDMGTKNPPAECDWKWPM